MTVLETVRVLAAAVGVLELLVMASRWRAWPLLSRPLRWIFLGLAGQALALVYGTWEVAHAGLPAGPRSYLNGVIQTWLLLGVITYLPRATRWRTRWRRRRRHRKETT